MYSVREHQGYPPCSRRNQTYHPSITRLIGITRMPKCSLHGAIGTLSLIQGLANHQSQGLVPIPARIRSQMWQVEAGPSCDKQHNRQSGFPAFRQFSSHAKMRSQTRVGEFKENTGFSLSNQSTLGKCTT